MTRLTRKGKFQISNFKFQISKFKFSDFFLRIFCTARVFIPYQPIALDCCFFLGSMVGIDGVAALTILALRLCSHCVVIGRPAQARNALLAAYFILDDDGVRGLSREQLVGVLTTEAGVGIDTDQVGWWASEDNSLFSHLNASALERQQERFSYREMFSEKTGAERVRLA